MNNDIGIVHDENTYASRGHDLENNDDRRAKFENLLSLFQERARDHAQRGFFFYSPGHVEIRPSLIPYLEMLNRAKSVASQIIREGFKPGSIFLLHFNNHYDNLLYFWATTCAGYTPAMSTPLPNNLDQRRAHLLHLWTLLDDPIVLTRKILASEFVVQNVLQIRHVEDFGHAPTDGSDCIEKNGVMTPIAQGLFKKRGDLAALMFTSGSTGHSKAVCLTHEMILESISGKSEMLETDSRTVFFNWIGADHVACLTEMHGHALWAGADQIYVQAADVVAAPLLFWNIVSTHNVTHSFAPNFFLASLLKASKTPTGVEMLGMANISSLKTIVTGGEANATDTGLALSQILHACGAPENCLKPAFGMTETSGGSVYSKLFPAHDVLHGYEFASVGKTIKRMEIRITDDNGNEILPGSEIPGSLEIRGSVVFKEYLRNEKATSDSFRGDWFITGDQGTVDAAGHLRLTGRTKDLLIINGVNYSPMAIEAVLENIEGTVATFTLVLPYRAERADSESLCVVYLPTYAADDAKSRDETNNAICSAVLLQVGVRPLVIPLNGKILQKSTIGKLARGKIQKAFLNGDFSELRKTNDEQVAAFRAAHFEPPNDSVEQLILGIFKEILDVPEVQLSATENLFARGVNSVDLIKAKNRLQGALGKDEIPTITIISNPTARQLAEALRVSDPSRQHYNPMVILSNSGSKAPLWLIHPGVGEVLVFLALASHFKDRPVYAMRARGFEANESYFTSIGEIVETYVTRIRSVQPMGPYAIAGYSFGSMIAFEMAKVLRGAGSEVRFLGIFNLPPHIKLRMRQLDWTNCLLHLSYFLNFFSEEHAHEMHPILQQRSREETLAHVLAKAPPERMAELGLDAKGLLKWADLAHSLQSSAIQYEPAGQVDCADVFAAVPLAAVARDMNDWLENHLSRWRDFVVDGNVRFHRVEGAHYTMISPAHVHTFQRTLKAALEARGI